MDERVHLGDDDQRDDERRCDEGSPGQQVNQDKYRNAKDHRSEKDDDTESFKDHISPISGTVPYA